jgi:hypothetical protein
VPLHRPQLTRRPSLTRRPDAHRHRPRSASEVLDEELETGGFLREHYDGGVILIEGFGNETILFHARISLTNNVYEGSYQKWDPALSDPPGQQIRWIVMRFGDKPDKTYREIYGTYKLKEYDEVFRSSRHVVYERKA